MRSIKKILPVAVVFAIVLSGCSLPAVDDSVQSDQPGGNDMRKPISEIYFYDPSGSPNPTFNETGFHYDGRILIDFRLSRDVAFDDVMLCVYDEDWNVITSKSLGNVSTGGAAIQVDMHTTETPAWVVVEHPKFADFPVQRGALKYQNGGYNVVDWNDVPGPSLLEAGTCR